MIITLWHANLCADRYDYSKSYPKRRPYFVTAVRKGQPDLISLAETQAPAADSLAKTFGMKAVSYRGSSILYNPAKFVYKRTILTETWLNSKQSHSLLGIELAVKGSGETFNVLSTHLPPFAYRANLRKSQMKLISQ